MKKGSHHSETTKARMKASHANSWPESRRQAMSAQRRGKPVTPEMKQRLSIANRAYWRRRRKTDSVIAQAENEYAKAMNTTVDSLTTQQKREILQKVLKKASEAFPSRASSFAATKRKVPGRKSGRMRFLLSDRVALHVIEDLALKVLDEGSPLRKKISRPNSSQNIVSFNWEILPRRHEVRFTVSIGQQILTSGQKNFWLALERAWTTQKSRPK